MRRPSQRAIMRECFASLPREVLPIMAKHHVETYAKSMALRAREMPYARTLYYAVKNALEFSSDVPTYRAVLIMRHTAAIACGAIYNTVTKSYLLLHPYKFQSIISSRQDTRYIMVVVDLPSTRDYQYSKIFNPIVNDDAWRGQIKIVSVSTAVLGGQTKRGVHDDLISMAHRTLQTCPP
jgi:hypothetical protein